MKSKMEKQNNCAPLSQHIIFNKLHVHVHYTSLMNTFQTKMYISYLEWDSLVLNKRFEWIQWFIAWWYWFDCFHIDSFNLFLYAAWQPNVLFNKILPTFYVTSLYIWIAFGHTLSVFPFQKNNISPFYFLSITVIWLTSLRRSTQTPDPSGTAGV